MISARIIGGRIAVRQYDSIIKDYNSIQISNYSILEEKGVFTAYFLDPQSRSITRILYRVMAANNTSVEFV